jgi:hypothetical protein
MSEKDWFRKESWSSEDKEDFFYHLNRSRKHNRDQYLRIKAYSLQKTKKVINLQGAVDLLTKLEKEYPNSTELSTAFCQKAECYELLGNKSEAIKAFRASFDEIRKRPNVKPATQITFGRFIIKNKLYEYYEEVLRMLDEFTEKNDLRFPAFRYNYFSICAIISNRFGKKDVTKECAQHALAAYEERFSGYYSQQKLSEANEPPSDIFREIQRLAR